jgi:hypothetical protein
MAAVTWQSFAVNISRVILNFGFVAGFLAIAFAILSIFSNLETGINVVFSWIRWILFWSGWSVACYILQLRLATGIWCLKKPRKANAPEFVWSRKTWGYLLVDAVILIINLGIINLMSNNWGGENLKFPLLCVMMVLILISTIPLVLFALSFWEDLQKYKKLIVQADLPSDDNTNFAL